MKKILITGANKGIGLEVARQLALLGHFIYLGCRDLAKGAQAVAKLNAEGLFNIEAIEINVSDEASVNKAAQLISTKTEYLDGLINNAGIRGAVPQTPTTVDIDMIKQVFETNFFGAIRVTQAFIGLMKKSEQPRIVNVTSDLASLTLHNDPGWAYYNYKGAGYGPSKTALNAYTVALAFELRNLPFKVNALNPGYTATDFNNHSGTKPVDVAGKIIVENILLDADGPTGQYISDFGITPW